MNQPDFDPSSADAPRALRRLAEQAARAGGREARRRFGQPRNVRLKADGSEVTDADQAAQRVIIACIRAERPDDGFIAEESDVSAAGVPPAADEATKPGRHEGDLRAGDTPPSPGPQSSVLGTVCWVIDPIDGTRNYVRNLPLYACSVAALVGGFPVAGAIYDPTCDIMYSAGRSEGLLINGRPFKKRPVDARAAMASERGSALDAQHSVAAPQSPAASTPSAPPRDLIVGIPSTSRGLARELVGDWIGRLIVRNLGSTALHLALVATGQLDAALATSCKLWDLAAGWLLVTAAGGVATRPDGKPLFPIDLNSYQGEDLPVLAASRRADLELIP